MAEPLKLESPEALPATLAARLGQHRALFRRNEFLDNVLKHDDVLSVAEELDNFLLGQRIHAYHCTREPAEGFFLFRGLRLTDVLSHQAEFLQMFGSQFTADKVAEMRVAWQRHFVAGRQLEYRNGRVWACLSRTLVKSSGTEVFFRFIGGEAIFMPLKRHPTIAAKLAAIGQPVVVEFGVPGAEVRYPLVLAKYVLGLHHRRIRADAHIYEAEMNTRSEVLPRDIISVTPLGQFLP